MSEINVKTWNTWTLLVVNLCLILLWIPESWYKTKKNCKISCCAPVNCVPLIPGAMQYSQCVPNNEIHFQLLSLRMVFLDSEGFFKISMVGLYLCGRKKKKDACICFCGNRSFLAWVILEEFNNLDQTYWMFCLFLKQCLLSLNSSKDSMEEVYI